MRNWPAIARRIRVPLGFLLAAVYLWLARPDGHSIAAGGLWELIGLAVRALASGHVRKNETLTTTGPYAYVRNPLYLGSLLLAAGFAMAARSWWVTGLATIFFVVIYLPVIRSEENFLRKQFPEFDEYSRNVSRFLPRLRPFNKAHGSFSRRLYCKHREYNAILGAVLMNAALIAKIFFFKR